jgi:hypothetical protein
MYEAAGRAVASERRWRMVDREHVLARLHEVRGWADYIAESLSADLPYEEGKQALLEELSPPGDLRTAREEAHRLSSRLAALIESLQAVAK